MTNASPILPLQPPQPVPEPEPPPSGYWLALLAYIDEKRYAHVLQKAADKYANEQFLPRVEMTKRALGARRPGPVERLRIYRSKTLGDSTKGYAPFQLWREQEAQFPKEYARDWSDYQELMAIAST